MTAGLWFLLAWAVACIGFAVHAVRRADALQQRPPRFVQWKDQPADDAAFGPYREAAAKVHGLPPGRHVMLRNVEGRVLRADGPVCAFEPGNYSETRLCGCDGPKDCRRRCP